MVVIRKEDVEPIEDTCGYIREIYQSDKLSLALALINPGKMATIHKHKIMEEIYFVLKGRGKIRLGKNSLDIQEGDTIPIPKDIYHAAVNPYEEDLELLVITHPRYLEEDLILEKVN